MGASPVAGVTRRRGYGFPSNRGAVPGFHSVREVVHIWKRGSGGLYSPPSYVVVQPFEHIPFL